jgi:HNH endonuclease
MAASETHQPGHDAVDLPVAGPPAWFEWEGVRWYRRPGKKGRGEGHYADRTGGMLHVAIWERVHRRRLPAGLIVHHEDHNPANNDPGNLVALTREEHLREHGLLGRSHPADVRADISERTRASWAKRKPHIVVCDGPGCGKEFSSTGQRARFCSPVCRAAFYRAERRARWAG